MPGLDNCSNSPYMSGCAPVRLRSPVITARQGPSNNTQWRNYLITQELLSCLQTIRLQLEISNHQAGENYNFHGMITEMNPIKQFSGLNKTV